MESVYLCPCIDMRTVQVEMRPQPSFSPQTMVVLVSEGSGTMHTPCKKQAENMLQMQWKASISLDSI